MGKFCPERSDFADKPHVKAASEGPTSEYPQRRIPNFAFTVYSPLQPQSLIQQTYLSTMPIDKLFKDFMQSPSGKGALGGAASGALVSLLMNKKARKSLGKTAVTLGGAAAVAGLGYYAYKKWQGSRAPQATPAATPVSAPRTLEEAALSVAIDQSLSVKIILAMVAATAADGDIDSTEMDRLLNSMDEAKLDAQENAKLTAALNAPPTAEEIASLADSPEQGSELYAASLSAIDLDTPAENLYLRRLARALALEPSLVQQLHAEVRTLPV